MSSSTEEMDDDTSTITADGDIMEAALRRLAVAVIYQAVQDAANVEFPPAKRRKEAKEFLLSGAGVWGEFLDLNAEVLRSWVERGCRLRGAVFLESLLGINNRARPRY